MRNENQNTPKREVEDQKLQSCSILPWSCGNFLRSLLGRPSTCDDQIAKAMQVMDSTCSLPQSLSAETGEFTSDIEVTSSSQAELAGKLEVNLRTKLQERAKTIPPQEFMQELMVRIQHLQILSGSSCSEGPGQGTVL